MCIIIIKQKNKTIEEETLRRSSEINADGLGVVWLDTFKVSYHKSSEWRELLTDRPFIAHFRYATVGKVCLENTHPFVCGKNKNELLMMNGTIKGLGSKDKTDSRVLAENLGKIDRSLWKAELEQHTSRFVTINTKTKSFQIYNRDLYTYKDGVWYSKDNVLQGNVVAVYGTLKKWNSNYYSYLSGSSSFVGSGETKDKYPLIINGLPYLVDKKGVGHNVEVDVFTVSDSVLRDLDALEGHPRWYMRKQILIKVKDREVLCWIYFNPIEINPTDKMHKTFTQSSKYFGRRYSEIEDIPTKEESVSECTQFEIWESSFDDLDEIGVESPLCIDCYNDLTHDELQNYHCFSCGGWFSENEVMLFNS